MTQKHKLLLVFWLVVACLAKARTTPENATPTSTATTTATATPQPYTPTVTVKETPETTTSTTANTQTPETTTSTITGTPETTTSTTANTGTPETTTSTITQTPETTTSTTANTGTPETTTSTITGTPETTTSTITGTPETTTSTTANTETPETTTSTTANTGTPETTTSTITGTPETTITTITGTPETTTSTITGTPETTTTTITVTPETTTSTITGSPETTTSTTPGTLETTTSTITGTPETTTSTTANTGTPETTTSTITGTPETTTSTITGTPETTTTTTTGTAETTTSTTTGTLETTTSTTTGTPETSTTTTTTTAAPGPCDTIPCGRGSSCEVRANQTYVCLCLAGEIYNFDTKNCENAKVFPGQLQLAQISYVDSMSDKTSKVFIETSQKIIDEVSNIFGNSEGYSGTIVLELRPIPSSRVGSDSKGVSASIEITFNVNSDITAEEVVKNITTAKECDKCLFANSTFAETDLCSVNPCDVKTTNCSSINGLYNCTCKESYIKTDYTSRVCIACPSGQQAQDSLNCVNCPFGYSGLNCNESWQLALVIAGSLLSGLLLISLIILPIVSIKSKKTFMNDNAEIGNPYTNFPARAPLGIGTLANSQAQSINGSSLTSPRVHKIPRARTTRNWNSWTNQDMPGIYSQQNLIYANRNSRVFDNQDDIQSRSEISDYGRARIQSQPQIKPYAENQSPINTYGQRRGQINPFFRHIENN